MHLAMAILPRLSATLSTLLLFSPIIVHGHGYLKTPRSRNNVAYMDGVWSGGTATTPAKESEPQSANRKAATATCGVIGGNRDYDYPKNVFGGALAPAPQACYQPGQIIDVEVILTAHHKGHYEFKMCQISPGVAPTQACFDANPLTFVSDTKYGATIDPNYPERAYIPDAAAGNIFSYKYQLPVGLSGDLVLLQWHYVTANSCIPEGYYEYNWPVGTYWTGPNPFNMATCGPLPLDGNAAPEQFWNCAEIKIANDCAGVPSLPPVTSKPISTPTSLKPTSTPTSLMPTEVKQVISSPTLTPVDQVTSSPTMKPIPTFTTEVTNPMCTPETNQCGPTKTCENVGYPGYCCSQYGWCGLIDVSAPNGGAYCGTCCQNGPCSSLLVVEPTPPSPTPPTPTAPTGDNYNATHGEDSRLIAYVGNWQTCPTASQVNAYSHVVIAFAVSYSWAASKNNCDAQCNIASLVPICNNMNNQALVDTWRAAGKKVILSFGGAGMGGSWDGDPNNCWDYCFGKEDTLATTLVTIIQNQKFDGIDIDYEYCYDIAGKQSGRCPQRSSLYTDVKAQAFLNNLTSKLRVKLDALQLTNGYNRGRYEVTHAPMDSDLSPSTSKYFQILKARSEDLDFIMPQFYNGVTRPQLDGIGGSGAEAMSAGALFSSLANDMFNTQPHKVVFGMCISDCSGTGSTTNAAQAVKIISDLRTYSNGQYSCNGGAFFWVAAHDTGGVWSDAVVAEVKKTAGCSAGPFTTAMPSSSTVTASPTLIPTMIPSSMPSSAPTSVPSTTPTSIPLLTPTTQKPSVNPTLTSTTSKPLPSPDPTLSKPTTLKPSTRTPTSLKPTLSKPTTLKPSTSKPSTGTPTSLNPTSSKPTTKTPTSKNSLKPTTLTPTTSTQCGPTRTCESIGYPGYCCSQYGWCGLVDMSAPNGGAYCGTGCQNGPCVNAL